MGEDVEGTRSGIPIVFSVCAFAGGGDSRWSDDFFGKLERYEGTQVHEELQAAAHHVLRCAVRLACEDCEADAEPLPTLESTLALTREVKRKVEASR
jgi:hypothetical protein